MILCILMLLNTDLYTMDHNIQCSLIRKNLFNIGIVFMLTFIDKQYEQKMSCLYLQCISSIAKRIIVTYIKNIHLLLK